MELRYDSAQLRVVIQHKARGDSAQGEMSFHLETEEKRVLHPGWRQVVGRRVVMIQHNSE